MFVQHFAKREKTLIDIFKWNRKTRFSIFHSHGIQLWAIEVFLFVAQPENVNSIAKHIFSFNECSNAPRSFDTKEDRNNAKIFLLILLPSPPLSFSPHECDQRMQCNRADYQLNLSWLHVLWRQRYMCCARSQCTLLLEHIPANK